MTKRGLLFLDTLFIGDLNLPSEKVKDRRITQGLSRGEAPPFEPGETFQFARSYFLKQPAFSHPGVAVNKHDCACGLTWSRQ